MKLAGVDLSRNRVSDQIKDNLKEAVLKGEFKPGDKLPREDQIAASFKVSKVSVREALRDLESEGIIEKRRGSLGGNFVAQPRPSKIDDLMSNLYHFGTITEEDFFEMEALLQQVLIPLVSERRTDEDLEKMLKNIKEREMGLENGKLRVGKIIEFYGIIADCCKNELCSALMRALNSVSRNLSPRIEVTRTDCEKFHQFSKVFYDNIREMNASAALESFLTYNAIRKRR